MAAQRRRNNGQARKRPSSKGRTGGRSLPGWLWGAGGLSIGLFIALLVNLELKTDNQDLDKILDAGDSARESTEDAGQEADTKGSSDQSDSGGRTADGEDEPEFEFYRVLPDQEVEVPDEATSEQEGDASGEGSEEPTGDGVEATADQPSESRQTDDTGSLVVQAGSFQELSAADRMKAELALLGVDAQIESTELEGGQTWHRVRAGPYSDRERVNDIRRRLRDNGIDTILLGGEE
jgi:cell division protein FtsN